MKFTEKHVNEAVSAGILPAPTAQQLLAFFNSKTQGQPSFDFTQILYYLGGLIAIGAMTLFMNLGWESFGGIGIVSICMLYAAIGLALTHYFRAKELSIPAGICGCFVVALTPLAIYGLQHALGFWQGDSPYRDFHRYIQWNWLYMELGTLAVAAAMIWRFRYPFMLMPVGVTLWYLSMDLASMLVGTHADWELRSLVSIHFGALMLIIAFWVDFRSRHSLDYAFWLYLFGVLTFWGGITAQDSNSEFDKFLYFCMNLGFIATGALVARKVFVVFGAIGCCFYLGHLAYDVFENSWLFPIALSAAGLGIVMLGLQWQKHEQALTNWSRSMLPAPMREFLETRR